MSAILDGIAFVRSNPMFVLRAARNAARLETTIPLSLLRWALERRPRGKGPERIDLIAADPALRIELTVDLYGTQIDVASNVTLESIENSGESFKVALRVRDLAIKAPEGSPAAMMVAQMDLSKPGNLLAMMPGKHTRLIEASDDRFVIDLFKVRALRENKRLRRVLAGLSFVDVRDVRIENDALVIGFAPHPLAIPAAVQRMRDV